MADSDTLSTTEHYLDEALYRDLLGPVDDPTQLQPHAELIQAMMTAVFPPAAWERQSMAAITPFEFIPFYSTPTFSRLLLNDDGVMTGRFNIDDASVEWRFRKAALQYIQ